MSGKTSALNSFLLIILLILSSAQLYFMRESASVDSSVIKQAILQNEYDKVGGKDNYETITELQKVFLSHPSNPNNIAAQKELLAQLKDGKGFDTTESQTETTNAIAMLTQDEIAKILENAVIEGNMEAPIIAIEYADLECPFCIRQYNDNKITQTLQSEYNGKVATAFKNHRGVNHSGTEVKALAVLCAEKVGGNEAYVKFYKEIFEGSTTSTYYQVTKLAELATKLGLDVNKWQSCVDNKETLAQFEAETAEAQKYGMRGTPGTLIFNKNTGKYGVVKGAYGYETFKSLVDSLLAE